MEVSGEAFVLHRRPYRNTSALVELLSRSAGKVSAVAPGARNRRKNFSLEPFNLLDIACRGRGSLLTLSRAEPFGQYWALAGESLYCGLYANELLSYFLAEGDAQPELFDRYSILLSDLKGATERGDRERCLREFELDLLWLLGFSIDFSQDINEDEIVAETRYGLRADAGFYPLASSGSESVSGSAIGKLRQRQWDEESLLAAKRICRELIAFHLNGRVLHSRELFR